MNCVVTAGPTYEPLDQVRRLTNFSTGQLGTELAAFLTDRGHQVTLLVSEIASWPGARRAARLQTFSTTSNLRECLKTLNRKEVNAIFHTAAVSDFGFGKIWARAGNGELTELHAGKLATGQGTLLAELTPTPKIIGELRQWFPQAKLIGWKFEVDGDQAAVLLSARQQLASCRTDLCVANGPGYGKGFGLVTRSGGNSHVPDKEQLFVELEKLLT